MSTLRSRLIRLASENPDLRPHLLPILKAGREVEATDQSLQDVVERVAYQMLVSSAGGGLNW